MFSHKESVMGNSTWLMFRTLQQNSVESRSAYKLLMELSRYAQDNETAYTHLECCAKLDG